MLSLLLIQNDVLKQDALVRFLTIFCLLFSFGLMAKDYKSLLATTTTNSYTDTITSGTTRWYRIYAINEYGTSKGSNVMSVSYSE